jgi:hypothetical protein
MEKKMKRLLLAFAILAVATAFTNPVFAKLKDAKNKTECEKAGGVWIEKATNAGPRHSKVHIALFDRSRHD